MQMQMSSDIISLIRMVMMANKMKLVNSVQWDLEVYIVLFWNQDAAISIVFLQCRYQFIVFAKLLWTKKC